VQCLFSELVLAFLFLVSVLLVEFCVRVIGFSVWFRETACC
jgi:hypothetical protein